MNYTLLKPLCIARQSNFLFTPFLIFFQIFTPKSLSTLNDPVEHKTVGKNLELDIFLRHCKYIRLLATEMNKRAFFSIAIYFFRVSRLACNVLQREQYIVDFSRNFILLLI